MTNTDVKVLIIGAGPSGLTMAIELARRGIPFRIIDKDIKPVKTSNALAVQTRTLEIWEDQGILKDALNKGSPIKGFNLYANNKKIAHGNLNDIDNIRHYILGLAQHYTEELLIEHLQKQNITIDYNVDLINFTEQDSGITAELQHKDGTKETQQADWMIACDGGHSVVRTKLNIPFIGKDLEQHFILADAKVKSELPLNELNAFLSDAGPLFFIRYDKEHTRIIAEVSKDPELSTAKTVTLEQVNRITKSRCPYPVEITDPIWTSGFWLHERIAERFRHNKIFLVGDAAHVHSPAGGQGMNTGIQDAYNLAWKLALVIQGKGKPEILETYQIERYPIIEALLKNTTGLTRMMTLHNSIACAIRNFVISNILKIEWLRKRILTTLVELGIHYKNSLLVKDCLSKGKAKAGMDMLNLSCPRNKDLMDYIRGTEHNLLIFANKDKDLTPFINLKNSLQKRYPDLIKFTLINRQDYFANWDGIKLHDLDGSIHDGYGITQATLYLVRPDKYIGFRGHMDSVPMLMPYLQGIFISSTE